MNTNSYNWDIINIMSDAQLDAIDLPDDVVSIPNPNQCGLKDQYIVGRVTVSEIAAFRAKAGLA